jgi:ubiquinone/menaquinone biosynthesis C-methylase UbiE
MDKSEKAVAVFNRRATDYQAKFMDLNLYHASFDLFCNSIEKRGATLLELACGPGNITKYLLEKRPDLKILATDLAPNMIELAKANNPEAEFAIMDSRNTGSLNKKFDALLCGFGLPYFSKDETIQLIAGASKILLPGGVVYLSTMEGDYGKSALRKSSDGKDEIFIHYHEAGYLTEALAKNGFNVLSLQRQEYPEPDGSITTDLIIIAKI